MAQEIDVPLFPLGNTLFPGTRVTLQIFEQRYLQMIKQCLKQESGFVVVLISKGYEVGLAPEIFSVGTYGRIVDWTSLPNGLLGITVEGTQRVCIRDPKEDEEGLLRGSVEFLEDGGHIESAERDALVQLLKELEKHPMIQQLGINVDYSNLISVLWCLCGLLPLSKSKKQYLLELDDPEMRLEALQALLKSMEG